MDNGNDPARVSYWQGFYTTPILVLDRVDSMKGAGPQDRYYHQAS